MYKLIVARNFNNGIGYKGELPWKHKSEDMIHFQKQTRNQIVIMGRCTWDSLASKPLAGRINIILTSKPDQLELPNHCFAFKSIKLCNEFIQKQFPELIKWVIGGAFIYNAYLERELVSEVFISQFQSEDSDSCDKFFNWFSNGQTHGFQLVRNVALSDICELQCYQKQNREELKLQQAMSDIIINGSVQPNRTGIATRSVFGRMFEYHMEEKINLSTGEPMYRLPLITSKKMFIKGIFGELKWFLSGGVDSKDLESQNINIWKENTSREFLDRSNLHEYAEGETGPIYGFQWRHWGARYISGKKEYPTEGVDQVARVIESLTTDPFSRRHIISGWNVSDLEQMCLPPCHMLYQFLVYEKDGRKYLSLMMTQRSCDTFLGLPFNIASLGIFLVLMANIVDMKPYKIIHSIADMHIYETHIEAAKKQIQNQPYAFPYIQLRQGVQKKPIEQYEYSDIQIVDYFSHGVIQADMVA